mgnify:CR=1 FL=1
MHWRRVCALALALVLTGMLAGDAFAQPRNWDRDGDRGRGGRGEWVLLGEKSVGFRIDRDVIRINHNEDWYRERAFRRLHLVAERNEARAALLGDGDHGSLNVRAGGAHDDRLCVRPEDRHGTGDARRGDCANALHDLGAPGRQRQNGEQRQHHFFTSKILESLSRTQTCSVPSG